VPVEIPEIEWRLVLCDLTGAAISQIGVVATGKQLRYRLNRPAELSFTVPADDARINTVHSDGDPYLWPMSRVVKGYRLEGTSTWTLRYVGLVYQMQVEADSDKATIAVTCFDMQQTLYHRLARRTSSSQATAGDLNTVTYSAIAGNLIAKQQVDQTISTAGAGTRIQTTGTFATTSNQTLTFEEGMTVGEALERLTDTRTMDVLFDPVDGVSGVFATMGVAAARGTTRADAIFGYDTATYNVASLRWMVDGGELANDVRVAGPRPTTGSTWTTYQATDATSITKHGRFESWRAADPDVSGATFLQFLADAELLLRKNPRQYLSITPFAERAPDPFTGYFLGDTISVYASTNIGRAISGTQRVYELAIDVDDNGFERVGEIVTGPQ
jgi:hypothetical protein